MRLPFPRRGAQRRRDYVLALVGAGFGRTRPIAKCALALAVNCVARVALRHQQAVSARNGCPLLHHPAQH